MQNKKALVSIISMIVIVVFIFVIANDGFGSEGNQGTINGPKACDANCEVEAVDCIDDLNEIDLAEYRDLIEGDSSAIVMLGFSGCPWCEELSPVLYDVVKAEGLDSITYYIDCRPDGVKENDIRYSDSEDLMFLKSTIEEFLNEDRQILAPTVIYLNNGEVNGIHVGTLDGHDAAERCLTEDELGELQGVLVAEINKWMR